MLKAFTYSLFFMLSICLSAQVAIGKESDNPSALLDFGQDNNKGIILPETYPTDPITGSITFDIFDRNIRYYKNSGEEVILTGFEDDGVPLGAATDVASNLEAEQGTIINDTNSNTSEVDGVLILDSSSKALVLPHVESPEENMIAPQAGTICYDTSSNSIAIFDGQYWYFWNLITSN